MGWKTYMRSKIPLKLVFIGFAAFAVNLLLIFGFQLLLQFRYPLPVDEALLAKMDEKYENCSIIDRQEDIAAGYLARRYFAYLVEAPDATQHLVILEKHSLANRLCYRGKLSTQIPRQAGWQVIHAGSSVYSVDANILDNSQIGNLGVWNPQNPTNSFFLIICLMCAVELIVYCLLFKRHEL